MVVDLALQRADVHGVAREPRAQVLDLGRVVRVHSRRLDTSDHLRQFLLQLRLVGALVQRKGVLHLRQQLVVKKLRYFGALGVHHAVETEVQVGLVKLEQLLQQRFQLLVFLAHAASSLSMVTQNEAAKSITLDHCRASAKQGAMQPRCA